MFDEVFTSLVSLSSCLFCSVGSIPRATIDFKQSPSGSMGLKDQQRLLKLGTISIATQKSMPRIEEWFKSVTTSKLTVFYFVF